MLQYSVVYKYNSKDSVEKFLKLSDALDRWWQLEQMNLKPSLHYIGPEAKIPVREPIREFVKG